MPAWDVVYTVCYTHGWIMALWKGEFEEMGGEECLWFVCDQAVEVLLRDHLSGGWSRYHDEIRVGDD